MPLMEDKIQIRVSGSDKAIADYAQHRLGLKYIFKRYHIWECL